MFYDPAWVERGGQRSGMGVVSKWLSGYLPVQAEFPDCEVGPMHGFDHSKWRRGTGTGRKAQSKKKKKACCVCELLRNSINSIMFTGEKTRV